MKTRRLKGHKAAATCCIASRARPGVVASSGEDGCICWFDLRCKDPIFTIDVGNDPISSLCFKGGNEDIIYASSGTKVTCLDIHMGSSWKTLETYNYSKEEINQISFTSKSYFLAAADDSGDVKIIDTRQQNLYKTLRAVHTSVSLSVVFQLATILNQARFAAVYSSSLGSPGQRNVDFTTKKRRSLRWISHNSPRKNISLFLHNKAMPATVCKSLVPTNMQIVTGGLDSQFVTWDFSKGRPYNIRDYAMPEQDRNDTGSSSGQCFNPAFVHSIAVLEMDMMDGAEKVCAVARGDGIVDIIDIESELSTIKSKSSSQPKKASQLRSRDIDAQAEKTRAINQSREKRVQLDYVLGGHTAAVSCVSFSLFGEKGKFLISGGNDASVKLWDWSKHFRAEQSSCKNNLVLNINMNKKVNWLCTTPMDTENLIVCDTSKVLKVYTVP